jgi:hypothetical protein
MLLVLLSYGGPCIKGWPLLSFYSDWLRAGRSGDRIPVERDVPPIQTGPGAHPTSCTMGTDSFLGVKYSRGVLLTTHPLLVLWSWKSRAIPLPTLWATTEPVTGTLYLYVCLASMLFGLCGLYGWLYSVSMFWFRSSNIQHKFTELRILWRDNLN